MTVRLSLRLQPRQGPVVGGGAELGGEQSEFARRGAGAGGGRPLPGVKEEASARVVRPSSVHPGLRD